MAKFAFLILALMRLATGIALANGGTFATSSVNATGNLVPKRKAGIVLRDELLQVKLESDWAEVEVLYTLQNRGAADTMTYGFPIDAASVYVPYNFDQSIEGFEILDGNRRLEITKVIRQVNGDGMSGADMTEQPYGNLVRNWFMTTLRFDRRETKMLAVRYRVRCMGKESGTSATHFWEQSPRLFTYTFKPAATWGQGRVGHLEIVVDASRLKATQIPVNSVAPTGWRNEDGKYHWAWDNADLGKLPDLAVNFDNGFRQRHAQATEGRLDAKWIQSIRVSSTRAPSGNENYEARNLVDGKLDTAWLPGSGRGEWIDVTFKRPVRLWGIGVLNGHLRSAQSLEDYGQPAEFGFHVYTLDSMDWEGKETVEKTACHPLLRTFPGAFVQWPYESAMLVKHFRMTITKVTSGKRFSQPAISELYIYASPKASQPGNQAD